MDRGDYGQLEAFKRRGGEIDDGYLIFDPGFGSHPLCVRIREAEYGFLSAIRNRITAGLPMFIFRGKVRSDRQSCYM